MAQIIAIANQKGGVGKTTTTINLAAGLGRSGKSVLIVDLDPQGNASSGLSIDIHKTERTIYEILLEEYSLPECIVETSEKGVQIVPSNVNLSGIEVDLLESENRNHKLKNYLDPVRNRFDVILIDCPPNLGILTLNALCAADGVIIPLQTEYYALEGITQLVKVIQMVQKSLNPSLVLTGVLLTMYDQRTNLSRMVVDDVRSHFQETVFETIVPRNVKLSEAPSYGQSILTYAIDSPGAVAYLSVAQELLKRI